MCLLLETKFGHDPFIKSRAGFLFGVLEHIWTKLLQMFLSTEMTEMLKIPQLICYKINFWI